MTAIMLGNRKVTALTLAALCVAGCAHSDRAVPLHGQAMWRPVLDARTKDVPETPPASILPHTHFAAAQLFASQGLYGKAITQCRKAIAVDHSYVAAYHRLGLLLSAVGRHQAALEPLRRAVELRPDSAILRNNLGFELFLSRRWAEAQRELTLAIKLKPDFPRACINLGIVQSKLGRFDEALATFRKVLPEPDAYYNVGLMYRGQQLYEEAAETFEYVLKLSPHFVAAATQLEQIGPHLEPAITLARDTPPEQTVSTAEEPPASADESVDDLLVALDAIIKQTEPPTSVKTGRRTPFRKPPDTLTSSSTTGSRAERCDIATLTSIFENEVDCLSKTDSQSIARADGFAEDAVTTETSPASVGKRTTVVPAKSRHAPATVQPAPQPARRFVERRKGSTPRIPIREQRSHDERLAVDQAVTFTKPADTFVLKGTSVRTDGGFMRETIESSITKECVSYAEPSPRFSPVDPAGFSPAATQDTLEPTIDATSSIDSWALIRELEQQLAIVRNEIDCLDTVEAETAAALARAEPDEPSGPTDTAVFFGDSDFVTIPTLALPAMDDFVGPPIEFATKTQPSTPTPKRKQPAARLVVDVVDDRAEKPNKAGNTRRRTSDSHGKPPADKTNLEKTKKPEADRLAKPTTPTVRLDDWRASFVAIEDLLAITLNELACLEASAAALPRGSLIMKPSVHRGSRTHADTRVLLVPPTTRYSSLRGVHGHHTDPLPD